MTPNVLLIWLVFFQNKRNKINEIRCIFKTEYFNQQRLLRPRYATSKTDHFWKLGGNS